jgi:hypothetical protein
VARGNPSLMDVFEHENPRLEGFSIARFNMDNGLL